MCGSIFLVVSVAIERHSAVCNPLAYRYKGKILQTYEGFYHQHIVNWISLAFGCCYWCLLQATTHRQVESSLLHLAQLSAGPGGQHHEVTSALAHLQYSLSLMIISAKVGVSPSLGDCFDLQQQTECIISTQKYILKCGRGNLSVTIFTKKIQFILMQY